MVESSARTLRPIDLARAIGLSSQQTNRFERWGLLPPAERSPSGRRRYTARHLDAVLALRAVQAGYGWRRGCWVMRRVHQGDLAGALALIDERHAALHRQRAEVAETLRALGVLQEGGLGGGSVARRRGGEPRWRSRPELLRIGEAAARAGVRASAVRFWEAQGLLQPVRDAESGFRLYDRDQVVRLQVVAVLRQASYTFEGIRALLDDLAVGRPAAALEAVERRREELTRASKLCARATAAFWTYLAGWLGEAPALSGTLPREAVAPLMPLIERGM